MSSTNVTSRIVVGSGLALVCAIGVSVFAIQARQQLASRAAFDMAAQPAADIPAARPAAENAAEVAAPIPASAVPPPVDPTTVNPTAVEPSAPPVVASAATPAPVRAHSRPARRVAPVASADVTSDVDRASSAASGANDTTESATPTVTNPAATTPAAATPAATTPAAAALVAAPPTVSTDSQITANARTELAASIAGGKVDVTTTDGVVTLAGSVPDADSIVQARQLVERIDGVKSVDTTAVTVSQQ